MVNQSGIQSAVQAGTNMHTTAQQNVPSSINNGNPNTAYNWASYAPQMLPPAVAGGVPQFRFNLNQAQAPASSAGYTPPFAADPYAAMLLAGMPQASSSQMVNSILARMMTRPQFNIPAAPTPTTPTVPPIVPPNTGGGGFIPLPPEAGGSPGVRPGGNLGPLPYPILRPY